jgi:hypothetical protein
MIMIAASRILLLAAFASPGPDGPAAQTPSAQELLDKVLASRKALKTGYVKLSVVYKQPIRENDPTKRIYELTFSGDQIRSIVQLIFPKLQRETRTIVTPTTVIHDDGILGWKVRARPLGESTQVADRQEAFDPRVLGLVINEVSLLWRTTTVETSALWLGVKSGQARVFADTVGDLRAWRIETTHPQGGSLKTWVVPDWGHALSRVELIEEEGGKLSSLRGTLSCSYRKYGPHWFLAKSELVTSFKGRVVSHEVIEVLEAEFNMAVDPGAFEMRSLGIEPGREVLGPGFMNKTWTGTQLVDRVVPLVPERELATTQAASRIHWWILSLVCGVSAIFVLYRVLRRA